MWLSKSRRGSAGAATTSIRRRSHALSAASSRYCFVARPAPCYSSSLPIIYTPSPHCLLKEPAYIQPGAVVLDAAAELPAIGDADFHMPGQVAVYAQAQQPCLTRDGVAL